MRTLTKNQVFILVAFVLGINSCQPPVQKQEEKVEKVNPNEGKFINVSDLHFSPYFDTTLVDTLVKSPYTAWEDIFKSSSIKTFSTYNHDSNYPLLESALKKMKEELDNPDYIMISGDFLSHHFEDDFTQYAHVSYEDDKAADFNPLHEFNEKTMRFIAGMIHQYFPQTPVFSTLGNNDAYCGDYLIQPGEAFLSMLTDVWKPLLRTESTGTFETTFPEGGYFSIQSPMNPEHKMIVLNSILFSTNFNNDSWETPYCQLGNYGMQNEEPGKAQLEWLSEQLKACESKGEKVWLMQHIPPGMNVYGTIPKNDSACIGDSNAIYWKPVFSEKYLNLVEQYAEIITTNMAGHYHRDDFRLMYDENKKPVSYMHILPSISPIYYNNPGFEVVTYDRKTTYLKNYKTYYTDVHSPDANMNWELEYSFYDTYGKEELNPESMAEIHQELKQNEVLSKKYMLFYPVSESLEMKDFKYYWCGISNFTPESFANCVCEK